MITIQTVLQNILRDNIDARVAMMHGYLNYSKFADHIHRDIEKQTKKKVTKESIVMALSRMGRESQNIIDSDIPETIEIKNLITKSPLTEISYEKNTQTLQALQKLFAKVHSDTDDFLTITYSTSEINITCSDRLVPLIQNQFDIEPTLVVHDLASLGISLKGNYYPMPGITYSFIKKIAARNIPLAETVTSHTEVVFTFDKKYLSEMIQLFS